MGLKAKAHYTHMYIPKLIPLPQFGGGKDEFKKEELPKQLLFRAVSGCDGDENLHLNYRMY